MNSKKTKQIWYYHDEDSTEVFQVYIVENFASTKKSEKILQN